MVFELSPMVLEFEKEKKKVPKPELQGLEI
jgi:hypothetical protein